MIRAIAMFVLLCSVSLVHAETVLLTPTATECTRKSLQETVDKYLDALEKGNPSLMPLATDAKYIENRKEIAFGEGIWQAPLTIDFQRSLFDVDICETFSEIIHTSSSHPYVIGTRLKVVNGKIAEVESLVSDENDWLFNATDYLKYSSTEKWDIIPPDKRSDRQSLIQVASDYFDIFEDYSAFSKVPWGIPCVRIEGGAYTNPQNDPDPSCTVGVPKGGGVPMTNRRYIVDLDMGAVVGQVDFGGADGLPDAHTFRLENGKLRYVHVITLCPNGCPKSLCQKTCPNSNSSAGKRNIYNCIRYRIRNKRRIPMIRTTLSICLIAALSLLMACNTEPKATIEDTTPTIEDTAPTILGVWTIEEMDVGIGENKKTKVPPAFMIFIGEKYYSAIRDFSDPPRKDMSSGTAGFMADAGTYEYDGSTFVVHHQVAMIANMMQGGSSMTFGCQMEGPDTLILTPQYDKMIIPGMKIAPSPDGKMGYGDMAVRYKFKRLE